MALIEELFGLPQKSSFSEYDLLVMALISFGMGCFAFWYPDWKNKRIENKRRK